MFSGPRNGNAIQHLEEVEVQRAKQRVRGPILRVQLAPRIEGLLGLPENLLDGLLGVELIVDEFRIAFVGKGQLILQVHETVVDRRSREHQHFGLHTGAYHLIHKPHIPVLLRVCMGTGTVAEVMRLVYDHQIVVAPVQTVQIEAVGESSVPREVRVEQNVVVQAVAGNGIVDIVILIGVPVLGQLFRAEDQHGLVAVLVVLDDRQCGESLTETDAIREDAAVVLLQLVNDGQHRISLKVVQHTPDLALFKARGLIRQHILGDVIQELTEYVVEHHVVDELRRVLVVGISDILDDGVRHVLHLFAVVPERFKELHILRGEGSLHTVDHIVAVVSTLAADIHRGEPAQRHVGHLLRGIVDGHEAAHVFPGDVGLEDSFLADPLCALLGDSTLCHFVA